MIMGYGKYSINYCGDKQIKYMYLCIAFLMVSELKRINFDHLKAQKKFWA